MVRLEEFLIDGRVDLALLSDVSRSRLIVSTRLAEEEMVLVTRPGARPPGVVSAEELSRTPLILGDGLRAAMDVLLAGRGIELQVDTELNDHETIRLMVQQGVGPSPETGFVRIEKVGFAVDSPLEEAGFELPVPRNSMLGVPAPHSSRAGTNGL